MAIDTSKGHQAMDYAEHNRTYAGFLQFTKYAVIAMVVLLAGMKISWFKGRPARAGQNR